MASSVQLRELPEETQEQLRQLFKVQALVLHGRISEQDGGSDPDEPCTKFYHSQIKLIAGLALGDVEDSRLVHSSCNLYKQNMSSPMKIRELPKERDELLRKLYKGHSEGFLQFGEGRFILPASYAEHADAVRDMPLRPDDVWVATFPRCGTTWTQELVWLVKNDLDYKKAAEINLLQRYHFIEIFSFVHEQLPLLDTMGLDDAMLDAMKTPGHVFAEQMPSPRFIKTHLPMSMLAPNLLDTSKVVYVARDPRDAAVSFYYHNKRVKAHDFVGDFKTYWDLFQKDLIPWSPFWTHVKEAWAQRHHPNMLFMFYEDLLKDLPAAIRRVSDFFERKYSDEQIRALHDHLDFKNFKNNTSVNFEAMNHPVLVNEGSEAFIRQGKAGGWGGHFDEAMRLQAQEWMSRHLQDTDLRFPQT